MRKIILLLGAIMMIAIVPAMAQVEFGVRVGGAYSSLIQKINRTYESGARFGYSVAGLADIHLKNRWSLRPEIAIINQGGSYYSAQSIDGMSLYNSCKYYSLQIPVNVAYNFMVTDVRLSVFGGPVFDWSFAGKMDSREQNSDLLFGMTAEKDLKPCDFGISLGLAVEYSNFFFSINSICGAIDRRAVKREGETSVYQNNVTLSLGYFFRKKAK